MSPPFRLKLQALPPPRHCQWWGLTDIRLMNRKRPSCCSLVVIGTLGYSYRGRLYSFSSHDLETFELITASSGSITVDLYNSYHLKSPIRPLIIYLPPTGVHLRHVHPSILSILHSHPLAAINYRWNHLPSPPQPNFTPSSTSAFTRIPTCHPFPTPLHDTLNAYNWLTTYFLPSRSSSPPSTLQNAYPTPPSSPGSYSRSSYSSEMPRPPTQPRPLIIYGSHLGGTLATSLALTECRASKSVSYPIAALVARDAIFDWTSVVTSRPPSFPIKKDAPLLELSQPWTLQTLHSLKTHLFANPAYAFDPFASPLLFFRTPSVAVPKSRLFPGCEPSSISDPVDLSSLSLSEAENAALRSAEFDNLAGQAIEERERDGKADPDAAEETVRSSHMKFPPKDSGLRIPTTLFLRSGGASGDSASGERDERLEGRGGVAAQAHEMARLMRRSVVLHELKDRVIWDEDADPHASAAERVRVEVLEGGGKENVEESMVGEFLEGLGF